MGVTPRMDEIMTNDTIELLFYTVPINARVKIDQFRMSANGLSILFVQCEGALSGRGQLYWKISTLTSNLG